MKKIAIIALCAWLALLPLAGMGESAYPAPQGPVTDLANVLSDSTIADIAKLSDRYEDAVGGKLYVITRHFLGGKDVKSYAQNLFDAWDLQDYDMLLLLVIGEESYALQLGSQAEIALPAEMAATYLSTSFHSDYMARHYDAAVASLLSQSAKRIAAAEEETLSSAGLFGTAEEKHSPSSFIQDLDSMFATLIISSEDDDVQIEERSILQEDKSSGISIWKIILVIIILRTIFGKKKKKKRYNFGHHPYR